MQICSDGVVWWCSGVVMQLVVWWCSGVVMQWCGDAVVWCCSGVVMQSCGGYRLWIVHRRRVAAVLSRVIL